MKVEALFTKPLMRNINGVVKAEQMDNDSVYVELDEYVITQELDRHFREFFEAYLPSCHEQFNPNTNMGVWIKGFFGSGKSHFLKILSYLIENREVEKDGEQRKAFDFFKEKITDALLLSDIHSAVNKDADVILFNIDSRANTDDAENAILKVFLKVFNERVGYCADFPHIAHLERELDKRQQFDSFKAKFLELTGESWETNRDAYDFYRDELAEAFAHATNQSIESARQAIEELGSNFPLDIKNFCHWVNEYINSHNGRHILFLVDEVGQFIGKNTQMMLKLQTIVEELGTICGGRAWVVVTSQADLGAAIGNIEKRDGEDFSKIQGRFGTKPSLSSSNTSEVIQKRLLAKTALASEQLTQVYAEKGDILRNQLSFDKTTTSELKAYSDVVSFVDNYPFIPYHYTLVQKVFESIRTKGATGKHLAMGERSLLDAFQSAAKQVKDEALDVLIPFHNFYRPIESFLEPAVKRTIDQACELESLKTFDGHILKTLFLIRYVDSVKSTLDNLITLSISRIDEDKISLKETIEASLNRLDKQLLITRNGDEFIFLTNEEKEIENEIRTTDVEGSELTHKLADILFDGVLKRTNQYRYPVNKQDFKISRFCNGHPRDGSKLEDLVLKIISPLDSHYENFTHSQHCLNHSLEGEGCILVKLGENKRLWAELNSFIQTERFLKQNAGQRPEQEHLMRDKQFENSEREKRLQHEFEDLFINADFFVIGSVLDAKATTPNGILDNAYAYILENTFSKLSLLKPTPNNILNEVKGILTAGDTQLTIDFDADECSPQAMREVEQYIGFKVARNEALYLRDLIHHFTRRPYGWLDDELLLIVARLGVSHKISFTLQNSPLALENAYEPFTNSRRRADIRILTIQRHDEQSLQKARKIVKQLFSKTNTSDEKQLIESIKQGLSNWQSQLKAFAIKAESGHYPDKDKIENGLVLVAGILEKTNNFDCIKQLIAAADALDEFSEDFEDLDELYNHQYQTWQTLIEALNYQFKANRVALEKHEQAKGALSQLAAIYAMTEPYGKLKEIKPLIETVAQCNQQIVLERKNHALNRVDNRLKDISDALSDCSAPSELKNKALYDLQQCKKRIENSDSIAEIGNEQSEASNYEEIAHSLINRHIESQREKAKAEQRKQHIQQEKTTEAVAEKPAASYQAKKIVTLNPTEIMSETDNPFIETAAQIDQCLEQLRQQLMSVIQAGDKVRLK